MNVPYRLVAAFASGSREPPACEDTVSHSLATRVDTVKVRCHPPPSEERGMRARAASSGAATLRGGSKTDSTPSSPGSLDSSSALFRVTVYNFFSKSKCCGRRGFDGGRYLWNSSTVNSHGVVPHDGGNAPLLYRAVR